MIIRKAIEKDIDEIERIYADIHTAEENGEVTIGWIRGVYPTRRTAEKALRDGDLFVMEDNGILGAAIINHVQPDSYRQGSWQYDAADDNIMVLHTLVISPRCGNMGYGKRFIRYYEEYAAENGCPYLRIDTNERNTRARQMYKKLGYKEIGIIPCDFNGIRGINLVLLEKYYDEKSRL